MPTVVNTKADPDLMKIQRKLDLLEIKAVELAGLKQVTENIKYAMELAEIDFTLNKMLGDPI